MKIIREGVCVKIIPKIFSNVVDGYCFKSEKKRLLPEERLDLIKLSVISTAKSHVKYGNIQQKYAAKAILKSNEISFVRHITRKGSEYLVSADGLNIRLDQELLSMVPEKYLSLKHTF